MPPGTCSKVNEVDSSEPSVNQLLPPARVTTHTKNATTHPGEVAKLRKQRMKAEMDAYRADLAVQATQKTEDANVLESETLALETAAIAEAQKARTTAARPPPAAQASQGKKAKPKPSKARGVAEPEVPIDVMEPDVSMDVD
jgi:hypothetical protein